MYNQIIDTQKRLSELKSSEEGVIIRVFGHGSFRKRITEMGFVRGKIIKVIKNAPMMDPVEYEIMGYHIALRRSEAELIEVSTDIESIKESGSLSDATFGSESINRFLHSKGNVINVGLVGNPNCGKTSLFNVASASNERVGNYSGVTVEAKSATFTHKGYTINLIDLPGTYSITEYSPEELYVREYILEKMPDVVVNVVDSTNLERNMFLTTQLIDMNLKVVMALNMFDELHQSGAELDYPNLAKMIGIPMVPTVASKNKGISTLFDKVIDVFEDNEPTVRHIHIYYGNDIETNIQAIQNKIWGNTDIVARYSSRYLAIKLLEADKNTSKLIKKAPNYNDIISIATKGTNRIEKSYGERVDTVIANAKYGFISGALNETLTYRGKKKDGRIDNVMTHRMWGLPIFFAIMWIMFQTTFSLGAIPAGWIESGVEYLSHWVSAFMTDGPLEDLIVNGILSGVGGVLVFLPNILILFLFISFMEDSGYMARAAFIMDKFMHKIGLHGKSFIPLLMGFGCNVPAIMATRTLESRKDRILTMLIIPFMSCSARMPVYILLISAFFSQYQGIVLLSIYMLGISVGIVSSLMLKKIFFVKDEAPFVMELPPYRIPTMLSITRHTWNKGGQYLKKMGTVILLASVIIWGLGHYPTNSNDSYIERMGRTIEPVIRPLGFDWKIGVSIVSGLAAKEIVVSTMAVLSNSTDEEASLIENLRNEVNSSGEAVYSPLVAYTLMVFILLYFPCIAVIAAIRREAGWKWAAFVVIYTTLLAWLLSLIVYQIGSII